MVQIVSEHETEGAFSPKQLILRQGCFELLL